MPCVRHWLDQYAATTDGMILHVGERVLGKTRRAADQVFDRREKYTLIEIADAFK